MTSTNHENVWKYIGITAATSAAVGVFLHFSRKDDREIVEIERLQMIVENLGSKIDNLEFLMKTISAELKAQRAVRSSLSGGSLKNVTFKLEASATRDSGSRIARTKSWQSITSDSEYGDAEDEWYILAQYIANSV